MEALQRRMEAVVLGLPSGSYAQRVQVRRALVCSPGQLANDSVPQHLACAALLMAVPPPSLPHLPQAEYLKELEERAKAAFADLAAQA